MNTGIAIWTIIVALFVFSPYVDEAMACQFDTDCRVGSQCIKPGGGIYGYCVGGMMPGRKYDRVPTYDPLDPSRKRGGTCSFSTDCSPGQTCLKGTGQIYGTCF